MVQFHKLFPCLRQILTFADSLKKVDFVKPDDNKSLKNYQVNRFIVCEELDSLEVFNSAC